MHTVWSDGSGTVKEMANAAIERGYCFIGIRTTPKASRLPVDAMKGQGDRCLQSVCKKAGPSFTVLKSAELNLSTSGEVDMDPKSLRKLTGCVSYHACVAECYHIIGDP